LIALATALPHGLVLLPALRPIRADLSLAPIHRAAALADSFATLCARWRSSRAFRPAACSALRYPFTAGCAACALRNSTSRLPLFGGTAASSSTGAYSAAGVCSSASTHSATAATITHALCRRQTDAGEQRCCGQQ
jgi:hypothetical protein